MKYLFQRERKISMEILTKIYVKLNNRIFEISLSRECANE